MPKIPHLHHLGHNKIINIHNIKFKQPFNIFYLAEFQKNLRKRFIKKFQNNDFGPQNAPFTPFCT